MTEYYFDMETYSPGERPDPGTDKIITIQFQGVDLKTGKAIGKLNILKEWESDEKSIITRFYNQFFSRGSSVWNFVPVGFKLSFEWEFLMAKFNKYLGKSFTSRDFHYSRPSVDLHSFVVLLNDGNFKGASLDNFSNKIQNGSDIKEWYEQKRYDLIEAYIKNETESYLELLQKIRSNIHLLGINKK